MALVPFNLGVAVVGCFRAGRLDVGCFVSGCCHVDEITWRLDASVLDASMLDDCFLDVATSNKVN